MAKKNKLNWPKILLVIFLVLLAALAGVSLQIVRQLPNIDVLNTYIPSESTLLYSADGKVLARFHKEENRQVMPLSLISRYFPLAVVATEDPRFFQHRGLDFYGIIRAGIKNLAYGRIVEGGSTITQQLSRNLFLTRRKSYIRKIAEALLSLQIERRYTKEEILEMYLNQVYLGHNSYGIESAANLYFGRTAAGLTLGEAAMLAGIIRGPELYSPYRNFQTAKRRQLFVLNKMLEQGLISEDEAKLAAIEELEFFPENLKRHGEIAPYFISYVSQQLIEKYGEDELYHGGLKVYTTLDTTMQQAAESVINQYVAEEGGKYHFSQAALVSLDPRDGFIKAMVGGADFRQSQYNRAVQAQRQPGSSFKPFIYTAALEKGLRPGKVIIDEEVTFKVWPNQWNPEGEWTPQNFDKKFHGPVTMRYALEKSLNIPSVKLLQEAGLKETIGVARKMGIKSHLEPGLALALGASEVNLLELTGAYGVLANNGVRLEPTAITRIESRDGAVLYEYRPKPTKVLDENIVAIMVDMMKGVLTRGTGVRGRLQRPAAAKTGTSQEFRDAWFIGFVPQLVTGVWVGNDDNKSMQGVAEVATCPRIWKSFNELVLANYEVLDFPPPQGLTAADYLLKPVIEVEAKEEFINADFSDEEVKDAQDQIRD
jgi:penicillin-binding protein 1A